jgi:hypothetical protein
LSLFGHHRSHQDNKRDRPSSDFTDLTRTISETVTPSPLTPVMTLISVTLLLSDAASEMYVTASQASTVFGTAEVVASFRVSITSFESLPSIPGSDYLMAESVSSHRTASEPSELSPESVYATAADTDLEEIPSESQISTPVLSSLKLGSERSISPFSVPSVLPSIRLPSVVLELLPEEIPLPPSVSPQVLLPLPSLTPTPSPSPLPALSPTVSGPPSVIESDLSPSPSLPHVQPIASPPSVTPVSSIPIVPSVPSVHSVRSIPSLSASPSPPLPPTPRVLPAAPPMGH